MEGSASLRRFHCHLARFPYSMVSPDSGFSRQLHMASILVVGPLSAPTPLCPPCVHPTWWSIPGLPCFLFVCLFVCFTALPLLCIIVNANQRAKTG